MRIIWPIIAGALVAGVVTMVTLPIVALAALVLAVVGRAGHDDALLSAPSSLLVREDQGHLSVRLVNHSYHTVTVPVPGEPRTRRLLLRQQVVADEGSGRVRVDAWPLEAAADLRKAPLYTIHAAGSGASIGEDGTLWVERGGRRSAFGLAAGEWLFDADTPLAAFTVDGEQRRLAALAAAEEDVSPRAVAAISYAAPGRVLRRVMLTAEDPLRARTLRATIAATRLVSRVDDKGRRMLELPLPAGAVRVPVKADDLDLGQAQVPAGLGLVPLQRWGGKP